MKLFEIYFEQETKRATLHEIYRAERKTSKRDENELRNDRKNKL